MPKRNLPFSASMMDPPMRSPQDLSHRRFHTFNQGQLFPITCIEVLPGDSFSTLEEKFLRSSTPLFPVMDSCWFDSFAFYVRARATWEHQEQFWGTAEPNEYINPADYTVPGLEFGSIMDTATNTLTAAEIAADFGPGSLWDHFGLPLYDSGYTYIGNYNYIDVRPFRAYHLICNEWFRNQSLVSSFLISKSDTASFDEYRTLWRADKRRDMFTSALPQPQKGPSVPLPLVQGNYARVVTRSTDSMTGSHPALKFTNIDGTAAYQSANITVGAGSQALTATPAAQQGNRQNVYPSNLWVDLTAAYVSDINAFRLAFATQRLYEAFARGGTRFAEQMRSLWNVILPDAVIGRPEYLGGSCIRLNMKQVAQTSASGSDGLLGHVGGYSMTVDQKKMFSRTFQEHGWLMVLGVARVDHTYSQGIERFWSRRKRFDYYYKQFAHLGDMPIYNRELFVDPSNQGDSADVFGYRPAWNEYRHIPDRVTGFLRPELQNGFQAWTYSDYYTTTPVLSEAWIKEPDANVAQTLATGSEEFQFMGCFGFVIDALRSMPAVSEPGLLDHF